MRRQETHKYSLWSDCSFEKFKRGVGVQPLGSEGLNMVIYIHFFRLPSCHSTHDSCPNAARGVYLYPLCVISHDTKSTDKK